MKEDYLIQQAYRLEQAEINAEAIPPLTVEEGLTIEDAYQIQLINVNKRIKNNHKVTGKKIGLTSIPIQEQLGVNQPDYGHLFNTMEIINNTVNTSKLISPRIEAEIAFVLKRDLYGPNVTPLDVMRATEYLSPSIEIIDSRIKDWKIQIQDTIADNGSAAMYVLGEKKVPPTNINLELIGMTLLKNGEVTSGGVGSAVLGNPAYSVAWLANKLFEYDIKLKAGEVILSGALTAAVDVEKGDSITARFANLGDVTVHFE